MQSAYRDETEALRERRDELFSQREREREALAPELFAIAGRRAARVFGGAAGIFGVCALIAFFLAIVGVGLRRGLRVPDARFWDTIDYYPPPENLFDALDGRLTLLFLAALSLAGLGYLFGGVWGPAVLSRALRIAFAKTDDVRADIDRLSRRSPAAVSLELLSAHEQRSAAWSLIAVSLLAPLGLHLVAAEMISEGQLTLSEFGKWIGICIAMTAPGHLTLVIRARRFARHLAGDLLLFEPSKPGWSALGWACLAGFVSPLVLMTIRGGEGAPFLFGVPLLSALTGALFVPLSFWWTARQLKKERATLSSLPRQG
jgi:hypothetical protein